MEGDHHAVADADARRLGADRFDDADAAVAEDAGLVGRENVIAGTDCGLGGRVGHPKIVWAKFEALAEGARLATRQLWTR